MSHADIALIALDLDGTLLNEEKQISVQDLEVIRKVMRQGVTVTLVSARPICSMRPFARQLGIDVPLISLSGAYISDVREKKVWLEEPLDLKKFQEMIAFFEEANYYIKAYSHNHLFVQAATEETLRYTKAFGVPYTAVGIKQLRTLETPPLRLAMFDEPMRIKKAFKYLAGWNDDFKVVKDSEYGLEVVKHSVSKGAALQELCCELNIQMDKVMAIGNECSDISMIKAAGLGIAVGNACEELRDCADFVTGANTESGVGYAITEHILGHC